MRAKVMTICFLLLQQLVFAKTVPVLQVLQPGGSKNSLSHLHQDLFCSTFYSLRPMKQNILYLNDRGKNKAPHFNAGKLPKQIVVGAAMGGILGIIAGATGAALVTASHPKDEWAGLGGFFIGVYSGFVIGNIGGVYIAGKSQKLKGSLWATAAGGAAGVLSGIGIASVTDTGLGLFVLPLLGATIAFNLSS